MNRHARIAFSAAATLMGATLSLTALSQASPGVSQTKARHFLWKVDANGGGGYLMGSLHVLTPEYYPLAPVINEAFDRSTTLVEEVDLRELELPATRALILSRATFPHEGTIDTVVSKDTVAMIDRRSAEAGLPTSVLKRLKPWMVAVTLLGVELKKAGFDPSLGLDRHFFDRATRTGKKIVGLETAAFQIERFDDLPWALQEAMLVETLNDADRQRQNAKHLADAWARGDTATLEGVLLSDFRKSPELYDRLLTERNRLWLPSLEQCFTASPPCFVVVGAAHLVGPEGLVSLLTRKGYKVEQQ